MTIRNLAVTKILFVALTVAAVALVPLTNTLADASGVTVKDGTELLNRGDGSAIQDTHSYPRSNYMWPYSTGPQYPAVDVYESGVLWTPAGIFHLQSEPQIAVELRASDKLSSLGAQYFAIAFEADEAVFESLRSTIQSQGGSVLEVTPEGSLVAKLDAAAVAAVQGSMGVLAVQPYHGAYKLEPTIGRAPLPDPIQALSDTYSLDVTLWRGEDAAAAAEAIRAIGGIVTRTYPDSLEVELHRSLLAQLADIQAVRMVTENLPRLQLAEETTATMQQWDENVGWTGFTPYSDAGIIGDGGATHAAQVLMVLDSGFSLDAGDLSHTSALPGTVGLGHRKVRAHESTNQFGGTGDTSGCDAPPQGGFTHGHVVSATALGNATNVEASYGIGYFATDTQGNPWELDGVARGALLVGYDGQVTPPNGSCSDPLLDSIIPGDLYSGGSSGSLGESYVDHGARIVNFSWGQQTNVYNSNSADIDQFLIDKPDAMVFVSAGNAGADIVPPGGDGVPDAETLGAPATTKNGLAIGASGNANLTNSPSSRAGFSSVGPAVNTTTNRVAPQLMAPGDEPGGGSLGLSSEFSCRSNDNDQAGPVICDIVSGVEGTSFSSPAAAGAALVVRDYFAQGFHPKGAAVPADSIDVGGALVKAVLMASADFMDGAGLSRSHRWNNEQGYGRIELENALPLQTWSRSPTGMLINDPESGKADIGMPFTANTGFNETRTFEVCNDQEELRVVLTWIDQTASFDLKNDLNMTLTSPTGIEYRGNYFTDDDDQDGVPEGTDGCNGNLPDCEDCGGIGAEDVNVANLLIDQGPWNIPVCDKTSVLGENNGIRPFDNSNPSEAVFLSHDPEDDDLPDGGVPGTGGDEGTCTATSSANANGPCGNNLDCRTSPAALGVCVNQDDYQQTELGDWTIQVAASGIFTAPQDFALVITGGVCPGSVAKFDRGSFTCNEAATVTITEIPDPPMDSDPSEAAVEARTTVQVCELDGTLECSFESSNAGTACSLDSECTGGVCEDCEVIDQESDVNFTKDGFRYESDTIQLTDGTARDPENGALDIRDGDTLRVVYQDVDPTTGAYTPPDTRKVNTATVGCKVQIGFGAITFAQFGQDSSVLVLGGCERNARDQFEFGFPDRYLDAGESNIFNFAFQSTEGQNLDAVMATLSCVNVDTDSPAQCLPNGAGCEESGGTPEAPDCGGPCDPERLNNTPCEWMEILSPVLDLGHLPAGAAISGNYAIQMVGDGPGEPFEDTGGGQPTPTVEMLLSIEAAISGKTASALAVSRQKINRDTITKWYSTDYPTGGSEVVDHGPGIAGNNDEVAQDPITELGNFQTNDYRFESFVFDDLTAGGTKNLNLLSPWNFDGTDGGFLVGLAAPSDETAADSFNIANWGEDKNFNNIEDGVCLNDPATACYSFPTDVRCGGGICLTTENNDSLNAFDQHWNTKGGCGWQTRATGECTSDATRGCFGNDDCLGTCHVLNNDIASTFDACANNGDCDPAPQCTASSSNPLAPCPNGDVDCGGAPFSCGTAVQECLGEAGTCGPVVGVHTGGIWHTGRIDNPNVTCDGGPTSACSDYKVIAATGGQLLWWELLVTPVISKVDTSTLTDGTNTSTIEIADWAWNQQANLSDGNAAYSWEFDTDVEKLEPVDLFADGSILGLAGGAYGAVSLGTNPDLTNGWTIFAPQGVCSAPAGAPCDGVTECAPGLCGGSGPECHVDAECAAGGCSGSAPGTDPCFSTGDCPALETCTNPAPEGCAGAPTCTELLESNNGSTSNNSRVGDAGCFFEGALDPSAFGDLGRAQPLDDDQDNDGDSTIDEFVQDDGPYRNHDIVAFNGPDMRFTTLEDFFGDTGDTFQAAIGFVNFEGTPSSQATQSYGLGVDDMVVKWREFTEGEDTTDCADSGSCAVIQLATTNVFEGDGVVEVTVLEPVPSVNDCDLDGTPDATNDCNGNTIPDVVIKATSEAEVGGEIVVLDRSGPNEYAGEIVVSVLGDSPGVLFLSQNGVDSPTVTVTYIDSDIDPGPGVELCPNDVDPTKHGVLVDTTTVFLFAGALQACEVIVVGSETSDNGDGDFFPDTEEIVDMSIRLINNCGTDLTNCTARLFSNSPEVDCILDSVIDVGDLADVEDIVDIADEFQWKVADLNRGNVDDTFEALFNVTMSCDQFNALATPQTLAVTLDLDLDDLGQTPTVWNESFESSTLGKFFPENLDAGLAGANNAEGLINGDGFRCQYNDPDWPNSNGYGNPISDDCYPGNNDGVSGPADGDKIHWNVDGIDTGSPDGGRAFQGSYAAYYGIYLSDPAGQFTSPVNTIESMATSDAINLGVDTPELTFWQQVSLLDGRGLNMPDENNADKGVVQGKLLNQADEEITEWFNLDPFQNTYDTQGYLNYFNCFFDPIDDGNTEDDFFDPSDPSRSLGPSSTCFPGFTWSCMGETALPFAVENTCNAPTQPAADSHDLVLGTGTWIETKVDLSAFRGQRMKLRYMVTGLKLSPFETWHEAFPNLNPDPRDDGWWVDDIKVSESLETAASLVVDNKNLMHCAGNEDVGCYTAADCLAAGTTGPCTGDAPKCGDTCSVLTAVVTTDPDQTGGGLDELLVAPGQPIVLDASGSFGTCLNGALQYRFSKDGGPVLRAFSGNPIYLDAPQVDTNYLVEVRCSTDGPAFACSAPGNSPDAAKVVDVDVNCPSSGTPMLPGDFETITADGTAAVCPPGCSPGCPPECSLGGVPADIPFAKDTFEWATPTNFKLHQGDLAAVSSYAGTDSSGAGDSFTDGSVLASQTGKYYVVREVGEFCNVFGTWGANECVLDDDSVGWWPAPGSGGGSGIPPTCDRDVDIP